MFLWRVVVCVSLPFSACLECWCFCSVFPLGVLVSLSLACGSGSLVVRLCLCTFRVVASCVSVWLCCVGLSCAVYVVFAAVRLVSVAFLFSSVLGVCFVFVRVCVVVRFLFVSCGGGGGGSLLGCGSPWVASGFVRRLSLSFCVA